MYLHRTILSLDVVLDNVIETTKKMFAAEGVHMDIARANLRSWGSTVC
jgi:hypothetical protein